MSYKAKLIRWAIKCTPTSLIVWGANFALKGIAKLAQFQFDLDARKVYLNLTLAGEAEPIELLIEDFALIGDGPAYHFVINQAKSNRLWMDNLLARILRKPLKLPPIPQLAAPLALASELLGPKSTGPGAR